MASPQTQIDSARALNDPLQRFRALSEIYAELASRERVKVAPYRDPALKIFSSLTPAEQAFSLENMNLSLDVFLEVLAAQGRLLDSPQLLWRTLRRLGLTPPSDIFDKIEDGDIVEVYSFENRQMFRNLVFFEFVSMSLEEVYSNRWYELTRRPPEVETRIIEVVKKMASGKARGTFDPEIPEHVFNELNTEGLFTVSIKIKHVSPVTSKGAPVGFIATNRSRVLSRTSA